MIPSTVSSSDKIVKFGVRSNEYFVWEESFNMRVLELSAVIIVFMENLQRYLTFSELDFRKMNQIRMKRIESI